MNKLTAIFILVIFITGKQHVNFIDFGHLFYSNDGPILKFLKLFYNP